MTASRIAANATWETPATLTQVGWPVAYALVMQNWAKVALRPTPLKSATEPRCQPAGRLGSGTIIQEPVAAAVETAEKCATIAQVLTPRTRCSPSIAMAAPTEPATATIVASPVDAKWGCTMRTTPIRPAMTASRS